MSYLDHCNPETLSHSTNQHLAYNIVRLHASMALEGRQVPPLHMVVQGGGGVGKSYLVDCLVKYLREVAVARGEDPDKFVVVAAPTGTAALGVHGCTLHSLGSLPVNKEFKPLSGKPLHLMQIRVGGLTYLIVDERSMCGKIMLGRLDSRLKQGMASDLKMGGVNYIFLGDDKQLPPVMDDPVYDKSPSNRKSLSSKVLASAGSDLFDSFNVAVTLTHNFRQQGEGPGQKFFREALERLASGQQTLEDIEGFWLKHSIYTLSPARKLKFDEEAIHLCSRKPIMKLINAAEVSYLPGPFSSWNAKHVPNSKGARNASSDIAGAENFTCMAPGAHVILTNNLWITRGLVNGSMGVVVDLLYEEAPSVFVRPAVVLVRFPSYSGPPALPPPHHPQIVPICLKAFQYMVGLQECTRINVPLRLSWAISIHKSQGMTFGEGKPISCCILHLGSREHSDGLTYVGCSRNMSDELMVFGGGPGDPEDPYPGGFGPPTC